MSGNNFVFIFDDGGSGFKNSKSKINAQVARYAHSRRRSSRGKGLAGSTSSSRTNSSTSYYDTFQSSRSPDSPVVPCGSSSASGSSSQQTSPTEPGENCFPFPNISENYEDYSYNQPCDLEHYATKTADIWQSLVVEDDNFTAERDEFTLFKSTPTFQSISAHLSVEELQMIQHWFTGAIPGDFGVQTRFDTFQSPLHRYPLTFEVALQWALATGAERMASLRGSTPCNQAYRSKAKALEKLRLLYNDPSVSDDEAVGSALLTLVNHDGYEKIHLKGMDSIIKSRGGLDQIFNSAKVIQPEHVLYMYTFTDFDIKDIGELQSLKGIFIDYLQDSPAQFQYRQRQQRLETATSHMLAPNTTIGHLIRTSYNPNTNYAQKARLFCVLLLLGATLLSFNDFAEQDSFAHHLEHAAQTATSQCPATGESRIMIGTLVFTVGFVRHQVHEQIDPSQTTGQGVRLARLCIAALKLFGVFSESMRERLCGVFQEQLVGLCNVDSNGDDGGGRIPDQATHPTGCGRLSENVLTRLSIEIDQAWLANRECSK